MKKTLKIASKFPINENISEMEISTTAEFGLILRMQKNFFEMRK